MVSELLLSVLKLLGPTSAFLVMLWEGIRKVRDVIKLLTGAYFDKVCDAGPWKKSIDED